MRLHGHPSTHGHHINPHTCGAQKHAACDGFSGGYDTYTCGCCCHDNGSDLTLEGAGPVWHECAVKRRE